MRFSLASLAVIALAQLVSATFITPSKPGNSCKKNEFWYGEKECCLPSGGPPKPTPPPTGVNCPPSWSWNGPKKCCLPHNPPPPKPPVPQCPKGWVWWPILYKCLPTPQPPTPHPPQPSKGPHNPHYPQPPKPHHGKRDESSRIALCPSGLRACPLPGLLAGDYECLDTATELTSCGGCVSEGKGQDCTAIKGAWNVGCERSSCVVYSCSGGFELSDDKKACIPL
ncbi:hypothetical protein FA13DRAFT_1753404 [Coprinellus micaceus]|uniref:Protein CPL1-like domain-containing protein n=1 Tax=Coprinellus micaceus TaxID=71717 RepID=A0A4Y7TLJ1_COPMI|nr:hypothetical protein FA13DRAFT_1753404 [Coprinellus micaceus]